MTESLLQECLELIQSGATLEDVLASYPGQASELRPLLIAALMAQEAGKDILPDTAAQSRSLGRFLSEAQQVRQRPRWKLGSLALRPVYSLALLLVVIFIATGSAVAVSAHALPGQPFYTIKLATENTRLMFATDPRQRLDLENSFDQERAIEVEQLIHLSRSISVNFTGSVSKIEPHVWIVSGMTVLLPTGASITPEIEVGSLVNVSGLILPDGSIRATDIQPKSFQFSGILNEFSIGQWIVDGIKVKIGSQTTITGAPAVGSRVWVSGLLLSDGSIQSIQLNAPGIPPVESKVAEDTPRLTEPVSTRATKNKNNGDSEQPGPVPTIQQPAPTDLGTTPAPLDPVGPSATPTQNHGDDEDHPSATPRPPENHANSHPIRRLAASHGIPSNRSAC